MDEDLADSIESCEVDRSNQCAKMKFETSFSQELCRQANLCNFYTFNPTDGLCLEFSTCQSNDEVSCKTCISGQPGCSNGTAVPTTISTTSNPTTAIPNDSDSFLLVVGGRDEEGYSNKVEVVSLYPSVDPVPECTANLSNLSITVGSSAAGAVLSQGAIAFNPSDEPRGVNVLYLTHCDNPSTTMCQTESINISLLI